MGNCKHCGEAFSPGKAAAKKGRGGRRARRYCTDNCRIRAFRARNQALGGARLNAPGRAAAAPAANAARRVALEDGRVVVRRGFGERFSAPVVVTCAFRGCGHRAEWLGKGRPRRFCSSACQVRHWRAVRGRA